MATFTNCNGSMITNFGFTENITAGVINPLALGTSINQNINYANGTGAGQIDLLYGKVLNLAGSATTLDLTSLTDLNGAAINFARVRELVIVNQAITAGFIVTIGAAASNAWSTGALGTATSTSILQPSVTTPAQLLGLSMFRWSDPFTVGASTGGYVDSTHKALKLDPGANTINISIIIAGCSAVS